MQRKVLQIGYEPERDRLTWDGWDIHCGQGLDVLLRIGSVAVHGRPSPLSTMTRDGICLGIPVCRRWACGLERAWRADMNCHYTDEQLKEDVERSIGIRARDIDKIQFCGLWHIRFRAFGTDFYYYRADSDDTVHLVESPWQWE